MLKLSLPRSVTSILLGIMATASFSAFSGGLDDANMLKKFSLCDASFFSYLNEYADEAKQLASIEQQQNFLNFKVEDRLKDGAPSTVRFTHPLQIGALTILGYQDNYSNLGRLGRYYYWGFVVKGLPDDVYRQLPQEIAQKLHKDKESYTRNEWKIVKQEPTEWLSGSASAAGEPTRPGTAERLLMIEKSDGAPQESTILCSVQGTILPAVLKNIRPDQYRIESDPGYIQDKLALARAITRKYNLDYPTEKPDEIEAEVKQFIDDGKKKYPIAAKEKPEAFWSEFGSIQRDFLNNLNKNVAPAQEQLRALLADKMALILDKQQLEDASREDNPVVAMVTSGAFTVDEIVRSKGITFILKPTLQKAGAFMVLEKKYGSWK
ncbi:hypothetical protein [Chromobacterium piscinae]|uniref:hypothetical protein n=1 Tax=Chromobacterium piscinae TaxID=686831 RepID=UPI003F7DA426